MSEVEIKNVQPHDGKPLVSGSYSKTEAQKQDEIDDAVDAFINEVW